MALVTRDSKTEEITHQEMDANLRGLADMSLSTFQRSGTGMAVRSAVSKMGETISLDDANGAAGDDATDNTTPFANAVAAAAGGALLVDKGVYQMGLGTLPAAGITIEGKGYDSVLKVRSSNQVLLQMVSGGWLRLYNIRLVGDGTSTSSENGKGLFCNDTEDIDLDTVWFEGFGFAAWHVSSFSNIRSRIRGHKITVTGGKNPAAAENADLYFRGKLRSVKLSMIDLEASPTDPVGNGLVIVQAAEGEEWEGVQGRQITIKGGHGKRGISIASEVGDATFNSGKVMFDQVDIYDTVMSALKTKNLDRVFLSNIYAENCDSSPEIPGNLQGSIFLNLCESSVCSNIQVYGGGSDAMRYIGRIGGTDAGAGRAKHVLTGLIASAPVETGLYVGPNVQRFEGNSVHVEDSGGSGIRINATTLHARPTYITLNSPTVARAGADGILALGLTGEKLGNIYINHPKCYDCFAFGILGHYIDFLQIMGGHLLDNGQGTIATHGARIAELTKGRIIGLTSKNKNGTTQTHGLSMGSGNTDLEIYSSDFSGNATGAVLYTAPSGKIKAANNDGWLEGSLTTDLASLADGAGTTFGITVTGAEVGDFSEVAFAGDALGLTIGVPYIASANLVSVRVQNETGGAVDLPSMTIRAIVKKNR